MADLSLKSVQGIFTQSDLDRLDKITADKSNSKEQKSKVLDQDAFMKILAAQLKYQDPLSPMKDQEFIGQMTQFNTLDSMNNLVELTKANAKTDKDMTAILAAMGEGIDKLVKKLAPEEATTINGDKTTTTPTEKTDSEKALDVSTETLEEIRKMTSEMIKMTEALKAYNV